MKNIISKVIGKFRVEKFVFMIKVFFGKYLGYFEFCRLFDIFLVIYERVMIYLFCVDEDVGNKLSLELGKF